MPTVPITVAYGDGIGPEIMEATLHILKEVGAKLQIEKIDIGEKVYLAGNSSGIDPSAWDSLRTPKFFSRRPSLHLRVVAIRALTSRSARRSGCTRTCGPVFRITRSLRPGIPT